MLGPADSAQVLADLRVALAAAASDSERPVPSRATFTLLEIGADALVIFSVSSKMHKCIRLSGCLRRVFSRQVAERWSAEIMVARRLRRICQCLP